jgi:rhomboid family GlyGly-CTERM serine protease
MSRSWPWMSLALAGAAVAVAGFPGAVEALQWNREAIAAGEVWRLFSGHWTHWTADHLFWDALMFAGLGALCERWAGRGVLVACWAISALAVDAAVLWGHPEISLYRGLSGIDSALFALATLLLAREVGPERRALALLPFAGFLGKVVWEWQTGSTLFVDASEAFIPLPLTHLAGALAGVAVGWLALRRPRPGLDDDPMKSRSSAAASGLS